MEDQSDKIESVDGELSEEDLSGVAGGMHVAADSSKKGGTVSAQSSHVTPATPHAAQGAHSTGHVAPQTVHKGG